MNIEKAGGCIEHRLLPREGGRVNFIENESPTKLRGGYYTDPGIARFLAQWVLEIRPKRVLEPSCGDGRFFAAIAGERSGFLQTVVGFEIEPAEAAKARRQAKAISGVNTTVHAKDFLEWSLAKIWAPQAFDGALGNPPFIRYQYLDEQIQLRSEKLFAHLGLPFTKHTNAWVPFVLASLAQVRPGGRLAMVVPAEILHILHAQSVRTFLGTQCSKILVIDPQDLWFQKTLQGVVLLLAEKQKHPEDRGKGGAGVSVGRGMALEKSAGRFFAEAEFVNGACVKGKWTRALLTPTERGLIDSLSEREQIRRFDEIASGDVGFVTGANKFFLVQNETVSKFQLSKFSHPMFGRSEHCPGVIYDKRQHAKNARKGNPTNFIWIKRTKERLSKKTLEYIELGETQKLHTRYKCRVRKPWYTVPSVYATEICMLKRASDTPRLILNRLSAYTTDTAYRIRGKGIVPERLVYCFLNALTALSAELEGRHYGGGVLELVPSEIEKLLLPLPKGLRPRVQHLNTLVQKETAAVMLEQQSNHILGQLGVASADQEQLMAAWLRLKNRRQRTTTEKSSAQAAA